MWSRIIYAARMVMVTFVIIAFLAMSGCDYILPLWDRPLPKSDAKQVEAIKDLQAQSGIILPTGTVIIDTADDGGREPGWGFYEWVIFSPSPITLPVMHATGVKDYLRPPIGDVVEFVQSKVGKKRLKQTKEVLISVWTNSRFDFSGNLARTPQGDYLIIMRFRSNYMQPDPPPGP